MSEFDLGTIKIRLVAKSNGQLSIHLDAIDDFLVKEFPLDSTKRLTMSKKAYTKYENEVFKKREAWVRDNVPAGSYSYLVRVTSKDFVREDFKFGEEK